MGNLGKNVRKKYGSFKVNNKIDIDKCDLAFLAASTPGDGRPQLLGTENRSLDEIWKQDLESIGVKRS